MTHMTVNYVSYVHNWSQFSIITKNIRLGNSGTVPVHMVELIEFRYTLLRLSLAAVNRLMKVSGH